MWDPVQDLTPSGISFNDIMLLVADPKDNSSLSYLRILSPPTPPPLNLDQNSCNYAQQAFPRGLDKMGVTIGILANQHMGRQRTTYDISHFGHLIVFQFLCCIY